MVASATTGKLFLDERHFSRSMNSELALIFKSCSRRALFISKSWKETGFKPVSELSYKLALENLKLNFVELKLNLRVITPP